MWGSWMLRTFLVLLLWFPNDLAASSLGNEGERWKASKGKVLELNDANFESAISTIDYIFVDFYAPWCGHCKRLSPELDSAARILSELNEPIVIAKINGDKYRSLANKYDVDGYPTLKIFVHGVPMDYYGPRKADLLVNYLKKFVAPDVSILSSDTAVGDFLLACGSFFPVFIGFGLKENIILNLAVKFKKKAWFAIANNTSEDVMFRYDFDKEPALLSFLPAYDERNIFYGPFDENFVEDFIKQSFLPLAVPINQDTLKSLKDDDRRIVLAIVESLNSERSAGIVKSLKAAASANRDLVFGYVGVKEWTEFTETFGITKTSKLPAMVVWNGDEEYHVVNGSESINEEEDQGSQISRFLEKYRSGNTVKKTMEGPSLMGFVNSLIGMNSVYIVAFVVAVIMILQFFGKEEPLTVGSLEPAAEERTDRGEGEKED